MAEAEAPRRSASPHPRYTLGGDAAAEARVAQDIARLTTGIDSSLGDDLRGLLLLGPFARAEGSIVFRDGEPYATEPGYQLMALFRGSPDRWDHRVAEESELWTRLLQAPVRIRAFAVHELPRVPATRFWYLAGRGWLLTLVGDPGLSLQIPRREPNEIRPQEAVVALCEGLTELALHTLRGAALDPAPLHAALLGCAEALLLRRGQYADTLAARAQALEALHADAALRAGYRQAIAWTARPDLWVPELGDLHGFADGVRRAITQALLKARTEYLGGVGTLLELGRTSQPWLAPSHEPAWRAIGGWLRDRAHAAAFGRTRLSALERLLRASSMLSLGIHVPGCRACAAELLGFDPRASDTILAGALHELARRTLHADRIEHPFSPFRPA